MEHIFSGKTIKKHWRLAYMLFAFLIAIFYDILFWNMELGINLLIFVSLYCIVFIILSVKTKHFHQPLALLLLIPIFVMSIDAMLYNNTMVEIGIPWFIIILLFLFSLLLTIQNPNKSKFMFSRVNIFRIPEGVIAALSNMYSDLFKWNLKKRTELYKKIVIGLVMSVPILFIFILLFSGADAVFADLLEKFVDFDIKQETVWRVFRTVVLTTIFTGIFYIFICAKHTLKSDKFVALKMDPIVVGVVLALVNALFFIFVFIQLKYLFGNAEYVLESGTTFAEYARSGFFQLAWVIVLAALLIIVLYRSASHHGSNIVLKILKVFLVVQVGVIAFSALHRMNLYQEAYGYTVMRLYVEWFIYLSIIILFFTAVNLIFNRSFRFFFMGSLIIGTVALCVVTSINVDYIIARQNITRFVEQDKTLDFVYLNQLSIDSFPVLPTIVHNSYEKDISELIDDNQHFPVQSIVNSYTKYLDKYDNFLEYNYSVEKAKYESKITSSSVTYLLGRIDQFRTEFRNTKDIYRKFDSNTCYKAKLWIKGLRVSNGYCVIRSYNNKNYFIRLFKINNDNGFRVDIMEHDNNGDVKIDEINFSFKKQIEIPSSEIITEKQKGEDFDNIHIDMFLTHDGKVALFNNDKMKYKIFKLRMVSDDFILESIRSN